MHTLKNDLRQGCSKAEAFHRCQKRGDNLRQASRRLSFLPNPEDAARWHRYNHLLILLYAVLVIAKLILLYPLLGEVAQKELPLLALYLVLIPGYILFLIWRMRPIGYMLLCFFALKEMIDQVSHFAQNPTFFLCMTGLYAVLLVASIVLKNRLFPFQNFIHCRKEEENIFAYR